MCTLCRFCFIKAFSNDPLPCLISEPPISGSGSLCVWDHLYCCSFSDQSGWLLYSMVYMRPISARENNKTSRCPRQSPLGCHSTAPPLSSYCSYCCCSDVGKPACDAKTSISVNSIESIEIGQASVRVFYSNWVMIIDHISARALLIDKALDAI